MQFHPIIVRLQARKALKGYWQTALVAAFCAGLFNTAYQVLLQLGLAKTLSDVIPLYNQNYPPEYIVAQIDWSHLMLPGGMVLLSLLLTPALQLGLRYFYLQRLSGQDVGFKTIFSRLSVFFKAFLLELNIQIRVSLWALLGLLPILGLQFLPISFPQNILLILAWISSSAAMVLGVMAYIRYAMAPFVMAEDPLTRVMAAIRYSKEKMKNNKAALFSVYLGFIGWMLLRMLIPTLLTQLAGPVVTMALELFADLALSVYMMATYAAFYMNLKLGRTLSPKEIFQNVPDMERDDEDNL